MRCFYRSSPYSQRAATVAPRRPPRGTLPTPRPNQMDKVRASSPPAATNLRRAAARATASPCASPVFMTRVGLREAHARIASARWSSAKTSAESTNVRIPTPSVTSKLDEVSRAITDRGGSRSSGHNSSSADYPAMCSLPYTLAHCNSRPSNRRAARSRSR